MPFQPSITYSLKYFLSAVLPSVGIQGQSGALRTEQKGSQLPPESSSRSPEPACDPGISPVHFLWIINHMCFHVCLSTTSCLFVVITANVLHFMVVRTWTCLRGSKGKSGCWEKFVFVVVVQELHFIPRPSYYLLQRIKLKFKAFSLVSYQLLPGLLRSSYSVCPGPVATT